MSLFDNDNHTIGELISTVLAIDNEKDATKFFQDFLMWAERDTNSSLYAPLERVKADIGWCFGEGMSPERIAMWRKVCGAAHPIFGTEIPTAEKAYQMGIKIGKKHT
jgi:hypothetical protein